MGHIAIDEARENSLKTEGGNGMKVRKTTTFLFVACLTLLAAFCPVPSFSAPALENATVIAGIAPLPDLQFSQIPAGRRDKYEGDRFSYMAAGPKSAPVVLFLHGVGATSMHWRFQYPVFGEKYRVIGWNAPGYLLSNNLKPEAPTCEDYGEAVNDFLTSLSVEKVYLVANSFGTVVGQCFAARYPQKVTKIAFTGTLIGDAWRPEAQKKDIFEGRKKGREGGAYASASGPVQMLVGKNTSEEKIALLRNVLRAPDLRHAGSRLRSSHGHTPPRPKIDHADLHVSRDRRCSGPSQRTQLRAEAAPCQCQTSGGTGSRTPA
jgi:pimeloyl-ACP methyl ester carboxylesterase